MHPEHLPAGQRKVVAVAILLALIASVVALIALPYGVAVKTYDDRLQRLAAKLEVQRAIVKDGEKARGQQRILERIEAANGFFLTSDKPALASAELQKRVKQVIEQNGGTVVSSQMLGEKGEQGAEQVVLRVQLRCNVEELQKVLYSLEAQAPILLLDTIMVGARPMGGITSARGAASLQQLDVRFDVTGFRHGSDGV